jgi:urease accessory protein
VQWPVLESAISTSVLALFLLVALTSALCALSHGFAHGIELPSAASPWAYASGFIAATALLHAGGYALARLLRTAAAPLVRIAGMGTAGVGVWWLAS